MLESAHHRSIMRTRRLHAGRLTKSAKMRPQLWQTVSRIFLILTTKPAAALVGRRAGRARRPSGQRLTDVEDGRGKLNVAKVARADLYVLLARGARVHAVNGAETGVIKALVARLLLLLVHGLGVHDVDDAHGLDLLGREQAELDLLDRP